MEVKLRGRRGRTTRTAFSSGSLLSGWRHYPRTGAASTLVVYNHTASGTARIAEDLNDDFIFADVATGFTAGLRWSFTHWPSQNLTYLSNGTDGLKSYNGSAIAAITQSGIPITGRYLAVWRGRLWGTRSDELNRSIYATDLNNPLSVPAANHLNLNDHEGGDIVGIVPRAEFILFFKHTSLWRFIGDIALLTDAALTQYSPYGCFATNSIANTPFGVIFLGRDGVYLTDGFSEEPTELSRAIRPLFQASSGATTYPNAVGIWWDRLQQYWVNLNPSASNDTYILHRVSLGGEDVRWIWSVNTNTPLNMALTWPSESDAGRLFHGGTDSSLYEADSASLDGATAIPITVLTASRPLDQDTRREGRIYRIKGNYRGSVALTGGLRYNGSVATDVAFTLGAAQAVGYQYPRTTVTDQATFGRHVAVSLVQSTDHSGFELHQVDLDARFRAHRVWR